MDFLLHSMLVHILNRDRPVRMFIDVINPEYGSFSHKDDIMESNRKMAKGRYTGLFIDPAITFLNLPKTKTIKAIEINAYRIDTLASRKGLMEYGEK